MKSIPLSGYVFWLILILLLSSCEKPEPIQIGFVAGLSGRVADLGVAGRNGAQLAVEQRNSTGGINGRMINLVVRDDEQNPETARRVVGDLLSQHLELIIGPMTSSMAVAIVPQVNASQSILLSPTVTTTDLLDKDDNFLRVISTADAYATKSARYQYEKLGIRTAAALYDLNNSAYTESWLNGFRKEFESLGGKMDYSKGFHSGNDTIFQPLVKELLANQPGVVLIISNAVDSALICQQVRKLIPGQRIVISEWGSTERFIELAGEAAEGVVVGQFLDRNNQSKSYQDFLAAYRARFKQEPGFAGVAGYDAALVAMEALSLRKPGESLKNVILDRKTFQGVQQPLSINRYGDADRRTFVTKIIDKQYVTME